MKKRQLEKKGAGKKIKSEEGGPLHVVFTFHTGRSKLGHAQSDVVEVCYQ